MTMSNDHHPDPRWEKIRTALRAEGAAGRPADEDLSAPLGFATRIVSRFHADQRLESAGLALWRRWSLVGAAGAVLLCGGSFLVKPDAPPDSQLIPLPTFEEPVSPATR
jgi:hypothetical protein